ncbi:hypothetical protein Pedsa_3634 [Pseudopedobacter saltans DSM 12145]|uniref:Cytochrome C oxidase subunit I n=1 Tax=Pseudopedobacter saltans (strain ATCC 51119 / DSM 12145 / JCM 21818 / CCUG 39354 / LMG 10337 / NBRC 100064 / NCIMB 13643) TaxID=762903 RepID=F0S4Y9_PSESL|nr:hypothetical protein [Pseudopedobacter saltans]ADY54163.1 hypothetical protein Pedsa_3634 [Pseudopedobacter saltans DSM 12145]
MSDIDIGKTVDGSVVLPFYATASVVFCVLCLLLFIGADSLSTHYFNPHLLTIVHTAALGWGTMIIFGAAYQLLPVVSERNLFSPKIAILSWYMLLFGTVLLVASFWNFRTGWMMISGGILIWVSAACFLINTWFTGKHQLHRSTIQLFILSSALWLLFTVTVGLLLAINLQYPFFSRNHLEILKLHAHAGLAGWFLQLIVGISSKLVPMFLLGKSKKESRLKYAFILQNAGLILFLCDGYFLGIAATRVTFYMAIVVVGILLWLSYLYDAFKSRIRKKIDIQMKQSFSSFVFLIIAVLMIPVINFIQGNQWTVLYGTLLFMGWITGLILGKTFKTLPFIVWNEHYKKLSGKVRIPLPKDLYSEKLILWQVYLFIPAILLIIAGVALANVWIIRFSALIWLALSVLYAFNVMKVLFHKTRILS